MPIIPQSIPAMYGGVSQQAAAIRQPTQCEEAINCDFSVARGVSKRPPLEIFNELTTADLTNAFFYWAHVDFDDRWFLVAIPGDGTYKVWDAETGTVLPVTNDTAQTYLTTAGVAKDDFFALAIDNKVYVVNKTIDTTMDVAVTAGSLAGTVQDLQDSSLSGAAVGSIWKILGDQAAPNEGYYVKESSGKFFEWVEPGITYQYDVTTMPHVIELFYQAGTPFANATFGTTTWASRDVGGTDSNEEPSFVGKPIEALFFKSDRFGFLSGQNFTMSQVGKYTNFWRTTVVTVPDDDRIDHKVNAFEVSKLNYAEAVGRSLVLFGSDRQFSVDGAPIFSPNTLAVNPITAYPASEVCRPVAAGASVYFISNAGSYSHLREMFIQPDTLTMDAANVTSHVDHYVPANVTVMEAHAQMDHLLLASTDEPGSVYSYQFYWAGQEKALSAWGRWDIAAGARVVSIKAIDSCFYVVYIYDGNTYVGKFNLKYGDQHLGLSHKLHLDHLQKVTANYNGGENRTYFSTIFPLSKQTVGGTFDYAPYLVRGLGWGTPGSFERPDVTWPWTRVSDNQFYVTGDWSGLGTEEWWIGLGYEMNYRFSEQFYVENNRAQLHARVQLRTMTVHFTDTGYFETQIKLRGRDLEISEVVPELISGYTGRTVGDEYFQLNEPQLVSGTFQFPVFSRASDAIIELVNSGPLPSNFQAAEWRAIVSKRTTR